MSYQVYDENGYVGDFATTKGMHDYMNWLRTTGDDDLGDFADNAIWIHPEALGEVLMDYIPPVGDIQKTNDNFISLLPQCSGIVMISDGLNDDLEDEEE